MREGGVPWPEPEARRYRDAGYWQGRPLGDLLWEWSDRAPDAVAVVDGDLRLTYRELARRADALAVGLLDRVGLRPGDVVVVALPTGHDFVLMLLACLRAGIAPILALPAHRERELRHFVSHGGARAVVVPDRWRGEDHRALGRAVTGDGPGAAALLVAGDPADATDLRALGSPGPDPEPARARLDAVAPDPGDIALFLLSGGTTGIPKLIGRTHDDYAYNARASAELCGLDTTTRYLVALPIAHNFPLACPGLLGTLISGGRVVLAGSPAPSVCLPLMADEGITVTAAVPSVVQRWLDAVEAGEQRAPASLRLLQVGGARLAPQHARRVLAAFGDCLQQVFGMAEGLLNYTRPGDPAEVVVETQGRPLSPDDEILVVDGDGSPVPPGAVGLLLTRGPYTVRGYFRATAAASASFTADGWYRTGDLVRVHPSGNLTVEGRDKDLVNRGGEKITSSAVEDLLLEVPGIAAAAVIGIPDPELGERVCAVVVPEPGIVLDLFSVRRGLERAGSSPLSWPERLVVLDELPPTSVGKIDKAAVRRRLGVAS
ncbi:AMP-binding protein [Pseudonocardia sp. NPDC046786]|uniref:(2,3-dihydroxybenzoyl)adenylate synthase n=1 Tax=Pseudonocardia sp. NPDC046786 TaxID=3155471 RepID=UPI0033EE5DB3